MSIHLLTTKLYFPPARANLVSRPRLIERLDTGFGKPLTLISAPAGYGKTSLLSAWRADARRDIPAAWLSLDAQDNELARFLEYVAAALETLSPNLMRPLVSLLRLPQTPPMEGLLTALINCVTAFPQDFALILDDYHSITEAAIHNALGFLLDHLPMQMHIILLTRSDPPLPLARLFARNQLTEIRQEHLLFTFDETTSFLKETMGLDLSKEDIGALETRTEGWIAGLHMAGLSLQNRKDIPEFIAAFQGDDRYVMDYLMEEVFRCQPIEIRDFLLQTSILDRLCSGVCDAITGNTSTQQGVEGRTSSRNSQSILEYLERNNLFQPGRRLFQPALHY